MAYSSTFAKSPKSCAWSCNCGMSLCEPDVVPQKDWICGVLDEMQTHRERTVQTAIMEFVKIDASNIRAVENMHAMSFPIQYSNKFFKQIQNNDLCVALLVNGACLGVVCCKFEIVVCTKTLYIMSLAVGTLHRRCGLGSKLLDFAISKAASHQVPIIRLHVQVNNINAIKFYTSKGFEIVETTKNYYRRCVPPDAFIMQKVL